MSRTPYTWSTIEVDDLKALWARGIKPGRIAKLMGKSRAAIIGKSRVENLHFSAKNAHRKQPLQPSNPAMVDARTIFRKRVSDPKFGVSVLKPGIDTRKLGREVQKGRWRGFPIYTLTLEERATCPRSCAVFDRCYGNQMWMARRWTAGPALEDTLEYELAVLQARHPRGFVVRLHILGDFYSVDYVERWRAWLTRFPALNVFGYSAWPVSTLIGQAVASLRDAQWERFAVRTSGASEGPRTIVIANEAGAGAAIICPAQTGRSANCSTCALCWHSTRAIAFLEH